MKRIENETATFEKENKGDETQEVPEENTVRNKKISTDQRIMFLCVLLLTNFHLVQCWGIYLVIPYHILATPEKGWTVSDLSIIFAAVNIGGIVASQICLVAEIFQKHRDCVLFSLHLLTFVSGILGFVFMSGILGFDVHLFYFGAFLCGICHDITTVQSYGPRISTSDEIQKDLLAKIGQMVIISGIISSFLLPAIYENAGFMIFCAVICGSEAVAVLIFCILIWNLVGPKHQHPSEPNMENSEDANSRLKRMSTKTFVKIPLLKLLSPSMFMLLAILTICAVIDTLYLTAYPIVFAEDFDISSTVGGYLYAASSIFSLLVLSILTALSGRSKLCQYPYDLVLLLTVYMIGNAFYAIFYAPWIAYSFHWIIAGLPTAMRGCEMVSRLYLCPPEEFNRMTSIGGFLKMAGFLLGAVLGPLLCSISLRLPFIVLSASSALLLIATLLVFVRRYGFLRSMSFHDDVGTDFLSTEKKHYEMTWQLSHRRKGKLKFMDPASLARQVSGSKNKIVPAPCS